MSVLDQIIEQTTIDVNLRKEVHPIEKLKDMVAAAPRVRSLKTALLRNGFSVIAEIKRRSPSAGSMNAYNVEHAIRTYNDSSAVSAISVLTDEPFFGGNIRRLQRLRERTKKPILRKDFILDEYQVWEARAYGADAILLMAAVHHKDPSKLADLFGLAAELGMQCLVEIGMSHVDPEAQAKMVPAAADIWGINSRRFDSRKLGLKVSLKGYAEKRRLARWALKLTGNDPDEVFGNNTSTDLSRHQQLRRLIPDSKIAVAESGIHDAVELRQTASLGYDAALVGTAFLRGPATIQDVVGDFSAAVLDVRRQAETAGLRALVTSREPA